MITRIDSMSSTREPPLSPQRPIVPRWVGVVFPLVILAAIGFAVAYAVNKVFLPVAVTLTAAAGIGLVAGFTVRWTLSQRTFLVRAVAALAALVVGLLVLGLVTRGGAGLGPFRLPLAGPDWFGVVQLALATVAAWMALQAWQRKTEEELPVWRRPAAWVQTMRERAQARWDDSALRRGIHRAGTGMESSRTEQPATTERPRPVAQSRNVRHRAEIANRTDRPQNLFQRFKNRLPGQGALRLNWRLSRPSSNHRSKVRFSGQVEHRCPYCLEVVEPNDPRGVKVCPICHTYHHAECWAVTGMCQVPHHHPESH